MNLGENIHNAFEIVAETYKNVYKLMSYCQEEAIEEGEFALSSPKFLRWKSDNEIGGWLMKSFILLFQHSKDKLLKNQWRKGPVYVLEINLNPNDYDEPIVNIAKFIYNDVNSWGEGVSPAAHWIFADPLSNNNDIVEYEGDVSAYSGHITDEVYSNRYWGLQRIIGIGVPLIDITRENAYETIFGGFRSLIDK